MVDKIISVLNSKYGIILAFIPIVNIAYLVFRMLFVRIKVDKIPLWYFAVIAVPAVVLYNILPGKWGWCVTHLIISCVAAFYMYKSRGGYNGNIGFKSNHFFLILVIFILVVSVNVIHSVKPAYSMGLNQEKLYDAINALVANDEEAWLENIHPEHGQNISNIDAVRKRFSVKLAALEGGYEVQHRHKTILFTSEVEEGKAAGVHIYVVSKGTGNLYEITAVWQECEHGSGLISVDIVYI